MAELECVQAGKLARTLRCLKQVVYDNWLHSELIDTGRGMSQTHVRAAPAPPGRCRQVPGPVRWWSVLLPVVAEHSRYNKQGHHS
jgi:hypothetical protein